MQTDNFVVEAPTAELAIKIAEQAETYRKEIAIRWTGEVLPNWSFPCLIFVIYNRDPWGWVFHYKGDIRGITIKGKAHDIFNHTLPHEITHTVLISYFGDCIPMWADEGMAVSSELDCPHRLEGKCGFQPLRDLFVVNTYPEDWKSFYGQSYSVTSYIVETYGRQTFLKFVKDGATHDWQTSCLKNLNTTLDNLENEWTEWVCAGNKQN